jgi:RNA polymerase sigma-70 factor, ECF subfamily
VVLSETRQLDADAAELIPRALNGDTTAHDALLRRSHGTVFRWALAHTGDADDAEDVAQEVLVRLVTHLDRYAGRSRFTTWLYQVTRNAARELHRRSSSRRRLGDALTRETGPAEASGAEQREETDLRDEVTVLYRDLPPRQREIFHLADLEELTIPEIAERLAMNPVTVRVHLFRARRTLRSRLLARHPDLAAGRR